MNDIILKARAIVFFKKTMEENGVQFSARQLQTFAETAAELEAIKNEPGVDTALVESYITELEK